VTRPRPWSAPGAARRLAAIGLAVAAGVLIPVQARVNGQLGLRLGDGLAAAAVSFGVGLVLLGLLAGASGTLRGGLGRLRSAVRLGRVPRRYLTAGALGASLALAQSTTALATGLAVFTVAVIAGQTVSGLLVDASGVGGRPRQRVTASRAAGGALIVVAALVAGVPSQAGADGLGAALRLALVPFAAGLLLALQQALNGATAAAARSSYAATTASFAAGAGVLVLAWGVRAAFTDAAAVSLPRDGWLYLGGLIGVVIVGLSAALASRLGLLLLTVGLVGGQLLGSLLLDLAVPAPGSAVSSWSVLAAVMTLLAILIVARRPRALCTVPATDQGGHPQ